MNKRTKMVKATLVTMVLFGAVLGQGRVTDAATVTPTPKATATPNATATPVMTDNLFKYGLQKEVEFPLTITAGGLNYTLHKVMIYDVNSADAKSLIKKYNYWNVDSFGKAKYLIWTKITIKNNSKKTVQFNPPQDLSYKWGIYTAYGSKGGGSAYPLSNGGDNFRMNSKESLRNFILKPGASLDTYQAFSTRVDPTMLVISLDFNGESKNVFLTKTAEDN